MRNRLVITIDLDKARLIAHDRRRAVRAELFKPHDERIKLALPGDDVVALDAPRKEIRELDQTTQIKIDEAQSIDELKEALG